MKIAELRGDPQLTQLLRDTVSGNVDTFFAAVRHGIPVHAGRAADSGTRVCPAVGAARRIRDALSRAYRLGHRAALECGARRDPRVEAGAPTGPRCLRTTWRPARSDTSTWISQRVIAVYQEERERWLENRNTVLRTRRFARYSPGGEIDVDVDDDRNPIPAQRRSTSPSSLVPGPMTAGPNWRLMERSVRKIRRMGRRYKNSLFISVDRVTAWGWIPCRRMRRSSRSRDSASSPWNRRPILAAGNPLPGVDGFRGRIGRRRTRASRRDYRRGDRSPGHPVE